MSEPSQPSQPSEMDELDALRALVREVIRDVLPKGLPETETVNLSTDDDLAEFVARLLDLDDEERQELRTGQKRFRLAAAPLPSVAPLPSMAPLPPSAAQPAGPRLAPAQAGTAVTAANGTRRTNDGVRRIDSGAVTEAVIRDAARAGLRLVLGRGAVLTPLARDRARASGVQIEKER
jgi:hypothetical protein